MLIIPELIIKKIFKQGISELPNEACGYLAGKEDKILKHYPMTNIDRSKTHFSLSPKEQFSVLKKAREEKYSILAVYHTHPATPARPSEEDIKLAYDPEISYVILSMLEKSIKSFKIKNKEVFNEEIKIIGD